MRADMAAHMRESTRTPSPGSSTRPPAKFPDSGGAAFGAGAVTMIGASGGPAPVAAGCPMATGLTTSEARPGRRTDRLRGRAGYARKPP